MSVYRRDFDKTKYMYFLIKDEFFFDKYNEIWDIIKNVDCLQYYQKKI